MTMRRPLCAALLLLLLASPALAAPTVEVLKRKVKKGRKLTVKARVTFSEAGEIRFEGDVNGKAVSRKKRVRRARTKKVRFRVSAKRLGLRRIRGPLDIRTVTLRIRATEESGAETTRDVGAVVPVPVVLLHGLGGEGTGAMESFAAGLELALPGRYEREGRRPTLILHEYESTEKPLAALGRELDRVVRRARRKTPFEKVDLVGESMGGLVIRSYLAEGGGKGRVRKCVLLATPNEGTPLAYVGTLAADLLPGLLTVPEGLPPGAEDLVDSLLDPRAADVLELFHPTWDGWLRADPLVSFLLPEPATPLADLNAVPPDPEADFHVFAYSDTGQEVGDLFGLTVGTVEGIDLRGIDLAALLAGGALSLDDLPRDPFALGPGDGLVPLRSALLRDVPAWSAAVTEHDLGIGVHGAMSVDPRVILEVARIVGE